MKNIFSFIVVMIIITSFKTYSQRVEITPVDFNSRYDDFAASLSQYGRMLVFTSARNANSQQAFIAEKTSGGWSDPMELPGDVNDASQTGAVTVTPDGQYMVFAAFEQKAGGEGRTDLFSARKANGKWIEIMNLGPIVNSDSWDSQPSLSSDGKTLYFASDRLGGYGGTDIYVSKRTREGWSKPENLGSAINTSSDDMSPTIGADNKTFYFSSNRSGGLGGFDIYVTRTTNNNFATPKNAGEPINSSSNEYFYIAQTNSNTAYFSSDRAGGTGELDIYSAIPNPYKTDDVVYVTGTVNDAQTKTPLGSDITVTDLRTGQKVADMQSDDETGKYSVVLQPGGHYSITANKKGYLFYSEHFDIPVSEKGSEMTKDIELSPSETRLLLFFDFDKFDLKDESSPEIERIVEYLRDNPEAKIQLEGHTDDVGSDDYNDKLSKNRADAVKKYIVNAGVDASRIKTLGLGKKFPLDKNKTDEARAKNRRVEMKVV